MICNKLLKVSHGTGRNNPISRPCDKFDSIDSFLNKIESENSFTEMQKNLFNEIDKEFAVNTFRRPSIIHYTCSTFSSDSFSLSAASKSVSYERTNEIQR